MADLPRRRSTAPRSGSPVLTSSPKSPGEAPPAASTSRIPVRKTYKLYVGGQFPRSESGRSYVVRAPDGTPLANAVRSSRKDVRDAVRTRARRRRRVGGQDRHEPRPGALPRGRADGGAPRPVRRGGRGRGGRNRDGRRGAGRPVDRPLGLVRRLGRQDHARCWARSIRSARRTSTSPSRRRPASSASSRPRRRRCWVSCRASRRPSSAAMPSSCSRPSRGRSPR